MKLGDLLKPLMGVLRNGLDVEIDEAAAGRLILYLLGDKNRDSETAKMVDEMIKGGWMVEAADGPLAKSYIAQGREWAEDLKKPTGSLPPKPGRGTKDHDDYRVPKDRRGGHGSQENA